MALPKNIPPAEKKAIKNSWMKTAIASGSTPPPTTTANPTCKRPCRKPKKAILQALAIAGDNRAQAAALLGTGRRTLYDKLEEYKI